MKDIYRIEIYAKIADTRAEVRKRKLKNLGFSGKIETVNLADVYTINKPLKKIQIEQFASCLVNPVTQRYEILSNNINIHKPIKFRFSYAIETGFLPGVTDNVGNTAMDLFSDLWKMKFTGDEGIFSSQITFISGSLKREEAEKIGMILANPLIQRINIKNWKEYIKDGGMDFIVRGVKLNEKVCISGVNLNIPEDELKTLGKQGISGRGGKRRGPLALDLDYLKTIKAYFKKLNRNPSDIEIETIAQTWSEHCKHTIFADPIDNILKGLFHTYIKKATGKIRNMKGKKDGCVSVFSDNSGAIKFGPLYFLTYKVETHNSPSALDPFGGSVTGIVGVNRDTIGFGLGAKPVANFYGFCLADPQNEINYYRDPDGREKMLSGRRIMDGVIEGVNSGGNCSGIPTPLGFLYFDERYRGKPLVFVGTIGIIPGKIKGKPSYQKKAKAGDCIVMVGGRVGIDGIHGATFSSESLNSGSPVTAVQIGDPITQKKLSDAIIKEARDMFLYDSITDNGAGGLSCSVAEMAKESGGCEVELERVPLKYTGLHPWQIWVSESQERMTLAVQGRNWEKFENLMKRRGVEATVIGKFTKSGKCIVSYKKKIIADLDMEFLHQGLPIRNLKSDYHVTIHQEPSIPEKKDLTKHFLSMLGRLNITSFEFISRQYDHIVQGNLVLGPLYGRGRINADAAVLRPVLNLSLGVVMSGGIYPSYSDIETYHMAACSIDTAIRNSVIAGANPDKLYLLDNFCWCDSTNPYRLGQLKRAVRACYDYSLKFQAPFISGKDSMFNDFHGYDSEGKPVNISIPPTLLITSIGIIDDIKLAISPDVKFPNDLVYLLGETFDELGGSEYFAMYSENVGKKYIGNNVPKVDSSKNISIYKAIHQAIRKGYLVSGISVNRGGIAVALAKMAMGGRLGIEISLKNIPREISRDDFALFSESQGRMVVSVNPKNRIEFEKLIRNVKFARIGKVRKDNKIIITGLKDDTIIRTDTAEALKSYRKTFAGY